MAVALRYLLSAISRIKQHESKLSLILHSVAMARSTNKVGLIIFYHWFEFCKGLLVEFLLKHSKKMFPGTTANPVFVKSASIGCGIVSLTLGQGAQRLKFVL